MIPQLGNTRVLFENWKHFTFLIFLFFSEHADEFIDFVESKIEHWKRLWNIDFVAY